MGPAAREIAPADGDDDSGHFIETVTGVG